MRPRSRDVVLSVLAVLVPLWPVTALAGRATPSAPSIAGLPRPIAHEDPAPKGVRVGTTPTSDELHRAVRRRRSLKRENSGAGLAASGSTAASPSLAAAAQTPGLWTHTQPSCAGSGTDGNRVQVIYAVEAGRPNRFAELKSVFLDEIAGVDDVFAVSSKETGGGRRVRWVREPGTCDPSVLNLTLPAGSLSNDTFTSMRSALVARGFTDPSRKYLVLADAARVCGLSEVYEDPNVSGNFNNGNAPAMFGRIDAACWITGADGSILAHELMHTLGGIQPTSPNHNDGNPFHCTDNADLMCYGPGVTSVCAPSHEPLFDCNNDDYFHTNPPAGSYLATNWNPASSTFLDAVPALPPTNLAITGPTTTSVDRAVTLSAALAPGAAASTYAWTVPGPDCSASGTNAPSVTVTCTATGAFGLTLTVQQSDGQLANAARPLTVTTATSAPPTVAISGPVSAPTGASVTLTSTVSSSLAATVSWSGIPAGCTAPGGLTGASLTFSCAAGGVVTAVATATQSDGQTAEASHLISVDAPPPPPPPVPPPPAVAPSGPPSRVTDPLVALPTGRPVISVSGQSRVRAGSPVVLTASSATVASWSWTASRACLVGRTTAARVTVQCPTNTAGRVTITVTGKQADGQSARASHAISLGGPTGTVVPSLTGPTVAYAGQRPTLTGSLRFGRVPIRGVASIQSSADGRVWRPLGRTIDLGASGRFTLAVAPARTTYYRMSILVAAGAGWSTPRPVSLRVRVLPRLATRLTITGQAGRPDVISGRLVQAATGVPVAAGSVLVQYRYAGSPLWLKGPVVAVSRSGTVRVAVQPGRRTYYRLVYDGATSTLASTSAAVFFSS